MCLNTSGCINGHSTIFRISAICESIPPILSYPGNSPPSGILPFSFLSSFLFFGFVTAWAGLKAISVEDAMTKICSRGAGKVKVDEEGGEGQLGDPEADATRHRLVTPRNCNSTKWLMATYLMSSVQRSSVSMICGF